MSGYTNILGRFVRGARSSWRFSLTEQGGTLIKWTHAFRPRAFRSLATRLLIAPIWRPYMRRALATTVPEVHRRSGVTRSQPPAPPASTT